MQDEVIEAQYKLIQTFVKMVEREARLELTDFEAALRKHEIVSGKVLEVVEKFMPSGHQPRTFDSEDCNFRWLNLPVKQVAEKVVRFLNDIRPEQVPVESIENFVRAVLNEMNTVFYHNFTHAATVMQVSLLIRSIIPPFAKI